MNLKLKEHFHLFGLENAYKIYLTIYIYKYNYWNIFFQKVTLSSPYCVRKMKAFFISINVQMDYIHNISEINL